MSDPPFPVEPPRLVGDSGEAGRVLAEAAQERRAGPDESAAFRRLERARRRRTVVAWVGTAAAAAAGLVLVSMRGLGGEPASPERVEVTAELPLLAPVAPPSALAPKGAPVEPPRPALAVTAARTVPPTLPHLPAESVSAAKCREWSVAGRHERAVECFRTVARGNGLEGEIALYEAARLSMDGLHDPARALGFLADYEKRFTGGAMRGEAAWLRVRALRDAGRLDDALATSEALLASAEGRALASELHWLRGQIYQDNRHDCAHAVSEFVALVGEAGERGDAAEVRRARCLEQLGRVDDAVQAYERYLSRPAPRREAEARERLAALRP